jgi:hypothetical protein
MQSPNKTQPTRQPPAAPAAMLFEKVATPSGPLDASSQQRWPSSSGGGGYLRTSIDFAPARVGAVVRGQRRAEDVCGRRWQAVAGSGRRWQPAAAAGGGGRGPPARLPAGLLTLQDKVAPLLLALQRKGRSRHPAAAAAAAAATQTPLGNSPQSRGVSQLKLTEQGGGR